MLGDKTGTGVLSRSKRGAVNESPEFPFAVDQRILHRGKFLIKADFVFVEILASDKTSFVVCFFDITVGIDAGYPAALDPIPANMFESRTSTVDEDYRFHDLLGREFGVLLRRRR